ncbi:PH domain-containing protein [Cellulosimicrobium protaetiae]|uniref:PH domain-containing protein n=1 Tax=Cellulosimicrobium protaetiae TaxID=2587808 RepID=UPI001C1093B0|nr:PH domain-containing protein [Cellulosimicrobium protaetiae]
MARGRPRSRILDRYVLSGERVVVATRHHWGMLLEPVATTVAGAVVVAWLVVQAGPAVGDGVLFLWWLWLILAGRLVWKVFEWRNEWFVATDKRLLLLYGLITHKVAMMPLTKVTDMNYGRSPVGRVFGYGQFLLESAGQDQALRQIDWVSHPDSTYRLLCDTLFTPGSRPGTPPGGGASPPPAPPSVVAPVPVAPSGPRATQPAEPSPVAPAPAWDGRSPATTPPVPAPPRADEPVVVVPGRPVGESSGPTQPLPVAGRRESARHDAGHDRGHDEGHGDDEPGWAISGEHRATYVPVIHPRPTPTPIPKPYEPGPGRDGAP